MEETNYLYKNKYICQSIIDEHIQLFIELDYFTQKIVTMASCWRYILVSLYDWFRLSTLYFISRFSFVNKNKSMIFLFNCFTMIILKLLVLGYSLVLLLLFLYLTKEKFISFCIFGLTGWFKFRYVWECGCVYFLMCFSLRNASK